MFSRMQVVDQLAKIYVEVAGDNLNQSDLNDAIECWCATPSIMLLKELQQAQALRETEPA